jgi:hypothetical protein
MVTYPFTPTNQTTPVSDCCHLRPTWIPGDAGSPPQGVTPSA